MALVMLLVGVAIVARLADVQVMSSTQWVDYGSSQRDAVRTVPGARGTVYDRDGQAMAMSVMRPTVWVDPSQVEEPDQVAARLAPLLRLDGSVVRAKVTSDGKARYRPSPAP